MNEIALVPTRDEMAIYETMAKYAHESKYFDKLGGIGGIMCIAMRAREMGIAPFEAIYGGFSNVQGKITMSAELMGNLIRRGGHKLSIVKSDNESCVIQGTRADTKETYQTSFTIQEAKNAGLVKPGGSWEKYPSDMLFARCLSRLRRRLFQDIATKAYVEGELEETEIAPDEPIKAIEQKPLLPQKNDIDAMERSEPIEAKVSIAQALELESLAAGDEQLMKSIFVAYQVDSFHKLKEKNFNYIKERILKIVNEKARETA